MAWLGSVDVVDSGEVIVTGQVSFLYWSEPKQGVDHHWGRGREVYLGTGDALLAGTNLFIDRNFNHNHQVNSASVK